MDIICPFHGQYEAVTRCFASIQNYTPNQEYAVHLIDDCSPNQAFIEDFTKNRKKTFGKRLDRHSGFGAAVNAGIRAGNSPYVVIMHSDVVVENIYWLYHLQKALAEGKSHGVKLVSARVDNAGTSNNYPPFLLSDAEMSEEVIVSDKPLPMICCIAHRELFRRVGMLKEYPYCWFEDEEFFHRMKSFGYKQGVAVRSVVKHEGGRSIKPLLSNQEIKSQVFENANRCLSDIKVKA